MKATHRKKGIIHLIDDEADIVDIATAALENEGYSVHSFTNAVEAINDIELKCRDKVFMLITDVRIPRYNGFEIARRVRAINPKVPIIFMTAFEIRRKEFVSIFPSLEVNEFLKKPFHMEKLIEKVNMYNTV